MVLFLCNCKYSATNNTVIIQSCLDSLHRDSDFDFLNQATIVLIKNVNSSGLADLHWGKNKISVKDTSAAEIKVYVPGDTLYKKRYMRINKFQANNDTAHVDLTLLNTNEDLAFDLVRNDTKWRVAHISSKIK